MKTADNSIKHPSLGEGLGRLYARQYHLDCPDGSCEVDEKGWTEPDYFDNSADLWMEVEEMWHCEEFSNQLQDWCDNANPGDVFEDDDIRVTVLSTTDFTD